MTRTPTPPTLDAAISMRCTRASADPWGFTSRWYEARKYALSVAMLPRQHYHEAFEPGCSVGVLTELLAPRCTSLLACDLAPAAVRAAANQYRHLPQVRVEQRTTAERGLAQRPVRSHRRLRDALLLRRSGISTTCSGRNHVRAAPRRKPARGALAARGPRVPTQRRRGAFVPWPPNRGWPGSPSTGSVTSWPRSTSVPTARRPVGGAGREGWRDRGDRSRRCPRTTSRNCCPAASRPCGGPPGRAGPRPVHTLVVADACGDRTAARARAAGAEGLSRSAPAGWGRPARARASPRRCA